MNSQFLPPQQMGGPPSRTSPQSFENVPLGPQKPPQGDHLPPQSNLPPSNQFPHLNLGGPASRPQIPSNQLPPSIAGDNNNVFNKMENSVQNGPPSFHNGPPQFQNIMTGPMSQPNRPPSNFSNQNQFGPPQSSNQNIPPRPPSSQNNHLQSGPPQFNQPNQKSMAASQPPLPGVPPMHSTSNNGPPLSNASQNDGISSGRPPSQPPFSGGPQSYSLSGGPPSLSQPPLPGAPPSQPPPTGGPQTHPPVSGPPSLQQPLTGGPPTHPPVSGAFSSPHPPSSQSLSGASPQNQSHPSLPRGSMPPLPGGSMPPTSAGSMPPISGGSMPPLPGGSMPPTSAGSMPPISAGSMPPISGGSMPPLPGGSMPPTSAGSMPPSSGGSMPPLSGSAMPPLPNAPPTQPQFQGQGMQSQFGPPQQTGQFGHQNMPPNSPPSIGQPYSSNQFGSPPNSQLNPQLGPPKPGQYPPQSRPGQPPYPGQNPFQNVSGPYPPSSGSVPQMPPLPGQTTYGANQLTNQMQGMNLSGPKQFTGPPTSGQMRGMNGEMGPHMPPPLNQQGYVNGQQARGPQGYPPMPGQPSHPGQPPMPGQPPLPGQAPMPGQPPLPGQYPGAAGSYPQSNYQQPQQARRLDPDQMPSPIQVIQDDQQNRAGVFVTNQKGLVPPLVTTNFIVQDQGNCSPRFIRSSMYNVPISQDIIKQTAVPFSLVISPMARQVDQEYPPPIVNFGTLGPVRCIRCKAYMCPYMQFVDSGRRFQCLFCMATTDVPTEYFQHLDHTGQRMDRYERPELILGTYEFVATADYCRNNTLPKPPAVIFVIDVSYNNIKSGLVNLLCSQMKDIIQNLPVDQGQEKSNMRVGFITYNSSVHFYNIKGSLAAPQMLVVGDVQEMFMPLLDGFLCTPEESGPVIDLLMQQIPAMFGETRETETVLLPAIQAGLEALKASECVGKLLVFHSTLPTADAPGKLKNRDDRKLLGTDKEKTILTPQTQAYNQLGQDCVGAGCSVDLFVFNNSYIDIATIGQVSRLTGGEVFKYTYFQADIDGERLINDIILDISRPVAFDAVMRVRTSTGVRPTDFYGHCYMSNTTDIELAAIDCDKAICVEIKHDDKLSEESGVLIQAALLYTSCSGQRRLRIMNLSLKTCSQMADLYRSCDLDTIINYISKQACYKLLDNNPKAVKESIVSRAAQILAIYRKNCASPSSSGQLILPECMKLLPLYVNCLLKNDALSGGSDMTVDDRSFVLQAVMIMDVPTSVHYFYPRLIPLHDIDVTKDPVTIPNPIRCSIDKMNEQGVYILENGIHMFLWFGLGVNPDFIQKLFGAPSAIQVDIDRVNLPELDNPLSLAVRNIIDEIRIQRHRCMRLTLVRQREKLEPVLKHFLVEDRGTDGSASYVDFLCHMHKEIRNLLS